MVAAPHGLGRVPSGPEPLDDGGFEGEEPTSDLDPDATEALDRGVFARELAAVVSVDPEPTRPILVAPPTGRPAPGVRLIDPEPTRPIDLASAPVPSTDPESTRPIELAPMRPRAAVIVRTVEEVDRTRPMDRDAVARVIGGPQPPSSEPDTRPIIIDAPRPRPTAEGPGFADVRPHDRTQPIPARRPRDDADALDELDDEPGDHTLAELED